MTDRGRIRQRSGRRRSSTGRCLARQARHLLKVGSLMRSDSCSEQLELDDTFVYLQSDNLARDQLLNIAAGLRPAPTTSSIDTCLVAGRAVTA